MDKGEIRTRIASWTQKKGEGDNRLYPASLIWCVKKQGRDLREKIELWLAWKRVAKDMSLGLLGDEFEQNEKADLQANVKSTELDARGEVWSSYRFVLLYDGHESDKLKRIDLGAGHSSSGETLCGRVISALKSESLLNESIGAGYLERNWPVTFKTDGEWPLSGLRQSFLDGSLTRLLDPETTLRNKIMEFIPNGDFGLASGKKPDGTYERVWFNELISPDEVTFDADIYLLVKQKAETLKTKPPSASSQEPTPPPSPTGEPPPAELELVPVPATSEKTRTIRISGNIPAEVWNRLGNKIIPKLKSGAEFKLGVEFSVTVNDGLARTMDMEIQQILEDLGLSDNMQIQ